MEAEDLPAEPQGRADTDGPIAVRTHLNPQIIVATAVGYVEEHGLAALTMRRLAAELGVEAMSLYYHVTSRDELLDSMVEHLLDTVDGTFGAPDATGISPGDWSGRMRSLATSLRHTALTHPRTFPLVLDHGAAPAFFRTPLRRASWYEVLLNDMIQSGLGAQAAVMRCHRLASFLLGYLLHEVAQTRSGLETREVAPLGDVGAPPSFKLHLAMSPTLEQLLARPQNDADFANALRQFIAWASVSPGSGTS